MENTGTQSTEQAIIVWVSPRGFANEGSYYRVKSGADRVWLRRMYSQMERAGTENDMIITEHPGNYVHPDMVFPADLNLAHPDNPASQYDEWHD